MALFERYFYGRFTGSPVYSFGIERLKAQWQEEHRNWMGRTLSTARYVYFWADCVYFNIRSGEARQCILFIIGVTEQGQWVAIDDGYRESEQSWMELLLDIKERGLKECPELAVGDGALGFRKAMRKGL